MKTTNVIYNVSQVLFNQPIEAIDNYWFKENNTNMGVSSLEEWVDTYEDTQFIKTGENTCLIISGVDQGNIVHALKSISNFGVVENIETLS